MRVTSVRAANACVCWCCKRVSSRLGDGQPSAAHAPQPVSCRLEAQRRSKQMTATSKAEQPHMQRKHRPHKQIDQRQHYPMVSLLRLQRNSCARPTFFRRRGSERGEGLRARRPVCYCTKRLPLDARPLFPAALAANTAFICDCCRSRLCRVHRLVCLPYCAAWSA